MEHHVLEEFFYLASISNSNTTHSNWFDQNFLHYRARAVFSTFFQAAVGYIGNLNAPFVGPLCSNSTIYSIFRYGSIELAKHFIQRNPGWKTLLYKYDQKHRENFRRFFHSAISWHQRRLERDLFDPQKSFQLKKIVTYRAFIFNLSTFLFFHYSCFFRIVEKQSCEITFIPFPYQKNEGISILIWFGVLLWLSLVLFLCDLLNHTP